MGHSENGAIEVIVIDDPISSLHEFLAQVAIGGRVAAPPLLGRHVLHGHAGSQGRKELVAPVQQGDHEVLRRVLAHVGLVAAHVAVPIHQDGRVAEGRLLLEHLGLVSADGRGAPARDPGREGPSPARPLGLQAADPPRLHDLGLPHQHFQAPGGLLLLAEAVLRLGVGQYLLGAVARSRGIDLQRLEIDEGGERELVLLAAPVILSSVLQVLVLLGHPDLLALVFVAPLDVLDVRLLAEGHVEAVVAGIGATGPVASRVVDDPLGEESVGITHPAVVIHGDVSLLPLPRALGVKEQQDHVDGGRDVGAGPGRQKVALLIAIDHLHCQVKVGVELFEASDVVHPHSRLLIPPAGRQADQAGGDELGQLEVGQPRIGVQGGRHGVVEALARGHGLGRDEADPRPLPPHGLVQCAPAAAGQGPTGVDLGIQEDGPGHHPPAAAEEELVHIAVDVAAHSEDVLHGQSGPPADHDLLAAEGEDLLGLGLSVLAKAKQRHVQHKVHLEVRHGDAQVGDELLHLAAGVEQGLIHRRVPLGDEAAE